MHWNTLIIISAVVCSVLSDPDPKKYKMELDQKNNNSTLTKEERKFLRDVETKFGIKSNVPELKITEQPKTDTKKDENDGKIQLGPGFPAVIAIEIVNDTDIKDSKGKRTIDANLGYGYRTNNGYMYSYFGRPTQEKGKFMIYPYSQHDIPPARPSSYKNNKGGYHSKNHGSKASIVEIQPSQAFELVPVNEDKPSYNSLKVLETPPPPYPASLNTGPESTLYTTYNGQQFSSLQESFPMVMSNYFVEPSQLLKNPHYQNVGLTEDHIKTYSTEPKQRIVPVLVLRIPSSSLKNPSAELYADLPNNYPLSHYLNSVNLQGLVNQYFKKIGFPYAPQIMAYKNSEHEEQPATPVPESYFEPQPQNYANPYVSPAYTQADYSGVQYSAVQPVMAKYPSESDAHSQYQVEQSQTHYEHASQPQYDYQYQYVIPQTDPQATSYYVENPHPKEHQYQIQYNAGSVREPQVNINTNAHTGAISHGYEQHIVQEAVGNYVSSPSAAADSHGNPQYSKDTSANTEQVYQEQEYVVPAAITASTPTATYDVPAKSEYYEAQVNHQDAGSISPQQYASKDTISVISSYARPKYNPSSSHTYETSNQNHDTKTIVISENYPSKDHTQVYVMPNKQRPSNHGSLSVQTVNYVTPMPHTASKYEYQTQYRVMVPQTVLRPDEKVTYVNSHSIPSYYAQSTPESDKEYNLQEQYSAAHQYLSPEASHTSSYYTKSYSHPKRMAKNHHKSSNTKSDRKPSTPRPDKKVASSKKTT